MRTTRPGQAACTAAPYRSIPPPKPFDGARSISVGTLGSAALTGSATLSRSARPPPRLPATRPDDPLRNLVASPELRGVHVLSEFDPVRIDYSNARMSERGTGGGVECGRQLLQDGRFVRVMVVKDRNEVRACLVQAALKHA